MSRNYWGFRTSRDSTEIREFILQELHKGRLRQGWGYQDDQNIEVIQRAWLDGKELSPEQEKVSRGHWRMGNGSANDGYMQRGDWILVANTPKDGFFTICEVTGDYYFSRAEHEDYGHIRPVKMLKEEVANNHQLVHADLRRSLQCYSRMWNIRSHHASLKQIVEAAENGDDLRLRSTPGDRATDIAAPIIDKHMDKASVKIAKNILGSFRAAEYEPVLQIALERLFSITVVHTGGPQEQGADLEIVIQNPFQRGDDSAAWIIPVQVKDYTDVVDEGVAEQLQQAFCSRSKRGQQVIAVALLVTNAKASPELEKRMSELSDEHKIPFIYCGPEAFREIIGKGLLSHSIMKSYSLNSET